MQRIALPRTHQFAPLCEQLSSPVSGLDLALDRVGEGHLDNFGREGRFFGGPVAQARSEAVRAAFVLGVSDGIACVEEPVLGKCSAGVAVGKDEIAGR